MFDDLLMIHIVSTSIMVGAIWVIQLVHYPSFKYVKESDYIIFQKYEQQNKKKHNNGTNWVGKNRTEILLPPLEPEF